MTTGREKLAAIGCRAHTGWAVLVVVAIDAEILPVAAVGRIVVVIAVLVVHREQVEVARLELAAAPGADRPVQGERPLAVPLPPRAPGLGGFADQGIEVDGPPALATGRAKAAGRHVSL